MLTLRKPLAIALGLVVVGAVATSAAIIITQRTPPDEKSETKVEPGNPASTQPPEMEQGDDAEDPPVPVKTVRVKRDANFKATVEQPAYVEAYYQDDLQARAAGPVKYLTVAIGDRVTKDQTLVVIDVPDIAQEVAQKAAVIKQREREKALAEAGVRAAEHAVREKEAYVAAKDAWREFKLLEYERFKKLAMPPSPAVTMDVVDERWKDYLVAKAEKSAAEVAVEKSRSDVAIARADVDLKDALIKVAEEDHKRAQEVLNLATVKAPFDGMVTRRNVNPGSFVHNASTGAGAEPLLRVERTDIVTIYTKIPDTYAPYVTPDTEAIIKMNELHGFVIRSRVTRTSGSLQTPEKDRTMRVEVDLFNGTKKEYDEFLEREKADMMADLKGGKLPMFPSIAGRDDAKDRPRLMPGMYGTMQLVLHKFKNAWLLPSSAIVNHGGKPYVFLVKDGIAHLVPVLVQVDNGRVAKVALLRLVDEQEVNQEFTGDEQVIISNQGELTDGQKVKATPTDW